MTVHQINKRRNLNDLIKYNLKDQKWLLQIHQKQYGTEKLSLTLIYLKSKMMTVLREREKDKKRDRQTLTDRETLSLPVEVYGAGDKLVVQQYEDEDRS